MVKSLITAFCASKNVLCGDGDAFKYFAEPELHNRYPTCPSLLQRKQIRSKGEKRVLNFTLKSSQQTLKRTKTADLISSAVVAEQQAAGRSTSSYEATQRVTLSHGKSSPVIIPLSLDPSPGIQLSSTSRSSTGTC